MQSFVYEILDENRKILYIGATKDPITRFNNHRRGKFKGQRISIHLVKFFYSFKKALKFEGTHKLANGFPWIENEASKKGGIKAKDTGQLLEAAKKGGMKTGKANLAKVQSMPNDIKVKCIDGHITSLAQNTIYCRNRNLDPSLSIRL